MALTNGISYSRWDEYAEAWGNTGRALFQTPVQILWGIHFKHCNFTRWFNCPLAYLRHVKMLNTISKNMHSLGRICLLVVLIVDVVQGTRGLFYSVYFKDHMLHEEIRIGLRGSMVTVWICSCFPITLLFRLFNILVILQDIQSNVHSNFHFYNSLRKHKCFKQTLELLLSFVLHKIWGFLYWDMNSGNFEKMKRVSDISWVCTMHKTKKKTFQNFLNKRERFLPFPIMYYPGPLTIILY